MAAATIAAPGRGPARTVSVAVVGAGMSGIAAAARLRRSGVEDVVVLERADEVGGTWRDNRYPGAACDVDSHVYELADAPNPGWRRRYAGQAEIQDYVVSAAQRLGVRPLVRLGHEVLRCRWEAGESRWHLTTTGGDVVADVVVAAPGPLSEPRLPDLPGLDGFAGRVVHTARWDQDLDLSGRRVAIVGTGASAIQVVPAVQPVVGHLTVFQRTPAWVIPRGDRAVPEPVRRLLLRAPALHSARRAANVRAREAYGLLLRHERLARLSTAIGRAHLRRQVPDPALRRLLTPDYLIGCKRVLVSDDYYPALQRDNVTLVPHAAASVTERAVVAADGSVHPADVLVVATGFRVTEYPFAERVVGPGGRRLSEAWSPSMHAHLGVSVPGFPNLFVLLGPHAGVGHTSVLLLAEAQVDHVVGAVDHLRRHGLAAVEARADAEAAFEADVERRLRHTTWVAGGCDSWYRDATGRVTTIWPGSAGGFRRRVARFRPEDYTSPGVGRAGGAAAGTDASTRTTTGTSEPARETDQAAIGTSRTTTEVTTVTTTRTAPEVQPTPLERVRGIVGRGVRRLPRPALDLLGRRIPQEVDGQHLDPPLRAMLATTHQRGGLTGDSPGAARDRYRRDVLSVEGHRVEVGSVEDLELPGPAGPLAARLYRPVAPAAPGALDGAGNGGRERSAAAAADRSDMPVLVWFHGGGFVIGDLDTHDEPCRLLCQGGRQPVLSVAYRLAPEHPFPAAGEDAVAALAWAHEHAHDLGSDRVAVGGDSAGGTISAVVAQVVTRTSGPPLAGQLLVYPATDRTHRRRPSHELFDGYLLTVEDTDRFSHHFYGYDGRPSSMDADPRISPLRADDLSGLPPAVVATAGFDVLRDEGEAYARALARAGTPVRLRREPALPHGFLHLTAVSDVAMAAVVRMVRTWREVVAAPDASDLDPAGATAAASRGPTGRADGTVPASARAGLAHLSAPPLAVDRTSRS